jgi:SNF2 family DNA or RNA helicase
MHHPIHIQHMGLRHGPNALKNEAVAQRKAHPNCTQKDAVAYVEAYYERHSRYPDVDIDLRKRFVRVILDEAHEIRNLSKQIATSILWLQPQYRGALTGTPTLNGIVDFAGIMAFIQPNDIYNIEILE